jgi:hypothetical protein
LLARVLVDDLNRVSAFWRLWFAQRRSARLVIWFAASAEALEFGWIDLFGGLLMLFYGASNARSAPWMGSTHGAGSAAESLNPR